jgi:hypothetical protein
LRLEKAACSSRKCQKMAVMVHIATGVQFCLVISLHFLSPLLFYLISPGGSIFFYMAATYSPIQLLSKVKFVN